MLRVMVKQETLRMGKLDNQSGFGGVEVLLGLVIAAILGFTGWYVWHAQQNANKSLTPTNSTAPAFKKLNKTTTTQKPATTTQPTTSTSSTTPTKTFNFIDETGWAKRSPTDKSFTVEFGASETYGYCSDKTGILLISMIYMNQNSQYTCGSIKNIVSPQSNGILYTRVAIGPSEQLWDKGDAQAISVTLPQGETAQRYDYTNTIGSTAYETIEYDVTYQGKSYVAVLHWDTSYDINSGTNIRPDYFDTIVQKTLTF